MDFEDALLRKIPFILTEDEWNRMPDTMKGRIEGDYNPGHMSGRFLGSRTLRLKKKTLIEGLDFAIEYSLI